MVLREGLEPRSGATEQGAPSETYALLHPASEWCRFPRGDRGPWTQILWVEPLYSSASASRKTVESQPNKVAAITSVSKVVMRCLLAPGGILTPATPLRCEVVHRPSAANAQAAQASAGMRGPGGDPSTEGVRSRKGS